MSGMSNMLRIALYRDAPSRHEPKWKRGTAARDATVPKGCSPFIQLVARGVMGGMEEWNAQDVSHAAHAVDPWVLDAYAAMTVCPGPRTTLWSLAAQPGAGRAEGRISGCGANPRHRRDRGSSALGLRRSVV